MRAIRPLASVRHILNGTSRMTLSDKTPWWAWAVPAMAWAVLAGAMLASLSAPLIAACAAALVAAVFAAVYHAEVVAARVGEPFGTLVLAVAVTVIEVALVVSVMLAGGAAKAELARDTVFAAVMIVCKGIVGLCLLAGSVRHGTQGFRLQGASGALAVLTAMTTLTLVLPNYTTSAAGPVFSTSQLVFVAVVSLVLYGTFVFVQTVRHKDDFLAPHEGEPHVRPGGWRTAGSAALLLATLVAVVGLAKALSPAMEAGLARAGAPASVIGVVIAALVLLPEGLAAVRAARADKLQNSLNLALGSALASIGLTIPAVAVTAIAMGLPLTLGVGSKDLVLLALTLVVSVLTLGTGRTTVLQGVVHLVIFAVFLFLAVVP